MDEAKKKLDDLMKGLNKKHGSGMVMKGNDIDEEARRIERWSLDSPDFNYIFGGGLPKGRIIELYGPESCIDEDTFIQYSICTPDGKQQNTKGGTIKRLYERFHKISRKGSGFYTRPETLESEFFVPAINENNCIISNKIADVVFTGRKECFLVRSIGGKELVCTKDHKFYVGDKYLPLEQLQIGDTVYIHDNIRNKKEWKKIKYAIVIVKWHPNGRKKIVTANDRSGNKKYSYIRYRVKKSNLIIEAQKNGYTYSQYVNLLNSGNKPNLWTVPEDMSVHHIDGNSKNDVLENLKLIERSEHYRHHAIENQNNLRFIAIEDSIESIVPVGYRETYDIKCFAPYNNYIANGIVVHNSGKTTIATYLATQIQKSGGNIAVIDVENSYDLSYAESHGLDVDSILFTQPDAGEDALEIAEDMVRSGAIDLIIIDSVSALTPRAEIEAEMGDKQMGEQARLMSKACRKLRSICRQFKTTIIFINQIRMKIGVMYGNPEVTSGGNALKFYSSLRLEVRRVESIQAGSADDIIGIKSRIKTVKSKVSRPYRKAEIDIYFDKGIDIYSSYLDYAVHYNIVQRAGSWYSYKDDKIGQGKEKSITYLFDHPELFTKIKELVDSELIYKGDKSELENISEVTNTGGSDSVDGG